MTLVIDSKGVKLNGYMLGYMLYAPVLCGSVDEALALMEHSERLEIEVLHECNDCGIKIPNWRPICTLCEKWYEVRGLPLPEATA